MYLPPLQIAGVFVLGFLSAIIFSKIRRSIMEALFAQFLIAIEQKAIAALLSVVESRMDEVNAKIAGATEKAAQQVHDRLSGN